MVTWAEFEAVAPALAANGRRLINLHGHGEALLATVRGDALPRIHPVTVGLVDGHLYAFIIVRSPKQLDLEHDGRYALHTHQDPAVPSEFAVRGRARLVHDPDERSSVAAGWWFSIDESYSLFEFSIEAALLGVRDSPDEWPPRYSSWTASRQSAHPEATGA